MSTLRSAPGGQRILFVVGLMRSGTSLLYRLLNNHPQIALLYESDAFALRPLLWPSWRAGTWRERLDFWNGAVSRHGIDGKAAALPSYVHGPAEATIALGRAYAQHKPAAYIGGKSVHYYDRLPAIARAFPSARFVVLWRPMEDIVDSIQRAGETNAYLAAGCRQRQIFEQYGQLARGVVALRAMGVPAHELRYEELVTGPETACRSICEFLELPWSAEMMRNDFGQPSPIPDQPHHFHALHTPAGALPFRPRVAPPHARETARCYERYWKLRFAGQPVRLASPRWVPLTPEQRPFFALERLVNYLRCCLYRISLLAKLLIYRFAPLPFLRWYRSNFGRVGQAPSAMPPLVRT